MDDPFDDLRTLAKTPAAADDEPADSREYAAFYARDNMQRSRVDIRPKNGFSHAIGYSYIIEICTDRYEGKSILLVANSMLVKIRGRNLQPVARALIMGCCKFIQEFAPEHFDPPIDESAPFISSIEIISAAAMREAANPTGSTVTNSFK
jgi:hypothetical protein